MLKFLAIFCLVYGLIELYSGFAKVGVMMNIVKMSFGKDMEDEKSVRIMYLSGAGLLVASVVLFILA